MPTVDEIVQVTPGAWSQAALILFSGILLAVLVTMGLTRILTRLTRFTRSDLDDRLIQMVRGPVAATVVFAAANLALVRGLGLESVARDRWPAPYEYGLAAMKTVLLLVWLAFAVRATGLVLAALDRRRVSFVQPQTLPLLDNFLKILVFGGAIYVLLLTWSIDVSAWLATAGIAGLALGLAAKDTLANLFAGLSILADAPYKLGDTIVLSTGERGQVTHIGIRSTRILTRDDIEVIIPNSILANTIIVNEAGGPGRAHRARLELSVAYGSDVDQVRALLFEVATSEPEVCETPEPRVRFRRFGDSGLELELLVWIPEPTLRGLVLDSLHTRVYKAFAGAGIEIPYPKRELYLHAAAAPPPIGSQPEAG